MQARTGLALTSVALLLAACEPIDGGGGGGAGGRLALIRNGSLVVSLDDGNGERTLTDPNTSAEPALSPTGATIAFAYSSAGDDLARAIYTVGFAAGLVLEALAEPAEGETFSSPAWSPDGATVVFVSTRGTDVSLKQVSSTGGAVEDVAPGVTDARFPAFLDANTLLVLHGAGLELKTLDLGTGALTELGITTRSRGAVAPGGGRIAFEESGNIIVRDLATGDETALASSGGEDLKPAFSFDGSLVAFESGDLIYASPADGSGVASILQSGRDVAWAP